MPPRPPRGPIGGPPPRPPRGRCGCGCLPVLLLGILSLFGVRGRKK